MAQVMKAKREENIPVLSGRLVEIYKVLKNVFDSIFSFLRFFGPVGLMRFFSKPAKKTYGFIGTLSRFLSKNHLVKG